jgi:hypothetical protein
MAFASVGVRIQHAVFPLLHGFVRTSGVARTSGVERISGAARTSGVAPPTSGPMSDTCAIGGVRGAARAAAVVSKKV